ncbi:MAG: hypothetical protein E6Q67_05060 [Roseateles sp.]|nr:MAG: hypothetical protein E6Q67_05060 [Roseateles sp.]
MKLLTQLYIMERAGKWIAIAGGVLTVFGLLAAANDPHNRVGQVAGIFGLVLLGLGIGMHVVMGDDDAIPVPEDVARVLDALEEHETHT